MVSFDNYSSAVGYTITLTWELLPRTCSDVAGVSDSETYTYVRMMEYTITGLDANSLYSITVLISNPAGNVTSHPINATTQEKGIYVMFLPFTCLDALYCLNNRTIFSS